VNTELDVIAVC